MKAALIGFAAMAFAGFVAMVAAPAQAQGVPPGSYLQSCSDVRIYGDRLSAVCRRADGGFSRTGLRDPQRCVSDIANINGQLRCQYAGGPERGPGYREGPGGDFRERCEHWRHEADELRERLEREGNPYERGRIEGRLHEVRERLERCRY
jgi:hypothetical protein